MKERIMEKQTIHVDNEIVTKIKMENAQKHPVAEITMDHQQQEIIYVLKKNAFIEQQTETIYTHVEAEHAI
jgi:hypothetical protein